MAARAELVRPAWTCDRRAAVVIALALGPPALVGLTLESAIERLGEPRRIAGGLLVGSLALGLADRLGSADRSTADAGAVDGLLLGLAQAAALAPGISRNGATLTAARARGFERAAADELSRDCGLPVILGAIAVRGLRWRAERRGGDAAGVATRRGQLVAGAAGAFASTLVARAALDRRTRPVSLMACAVYRTTLAAVVLAGLRRRRDFAGDRGFRLRHTRGPDQRTI